ncbi:MAG: hypothetical protein QM804_01115 [Propionicimonas sp.]
MTEPFDRERWLADRLSNWGHARRIAKELVEHADDEGVVVTGLGTLGKATGLSNKQVSDALRELQQAGAVGFVKTVPYVGTTYQLRRTSSPVVVRRAPVVRFEGGSPVAANEAAEAILDDPLRATHATAR